MSLPAAAPELEGRLGALGGVVAHSDLHGRRGRVNDLIGLIVEASGLEAYWSTLDSHRLTRERSAARPVPAGPESPAEG